MSTETIYYSFSDHLRNFVASKVRNSEDVNDLVQDIFVRIHNNVDRIKDDDKLESWIFSIARNSINDFYRKSSTTSGTDEMFNEFLIRTETDEELQALKDCLRPFVLNLPETIKRAVYLSEIKGMKHKVVAEKLQISLPAAKERIRRGREMIKSNFVSCCNFKKDSSGKLTGEHLCH